MMTNPDCVGVRGFRNGDSMSSTRRRRTSTTSLREDLRSSRLGSNDVDVPTCQPNPADAATSGRQRKTPLPRIVNPSAQKDIRRVLVLVFLD